MARYITLSPTQRQELLDGKKTGKSHLYRCRCNLILLSDQGYDMTQIASLESITRQTVANWFNRYEAGGIRGLQTTKGQGRPPIVRLDNKKEVNKIERLVKRHPQKLDQALEKIKATTGKSMSKKTLQRLLKKSAGAGNASAASLPDGPLKSR